MNLHLTITIGALDHPHVTVEPAEEPDEEPWLRVQLSETVSIAGDAADMRRWLEELAFKAASA